MKAVLVYDAGDTLSVPALIQGDTLRIYMPSGMDDVPLSVELDVAEITKTLKAGSTHE